MGYQEFIEGLEERGFPAPRIVVPLLIALAIIGIGYFVYTSFFAFASRDYTITVTEDRFNQPVEGAQVSLIAGGTEIASRETDALGVARFSKVKVPAGASVSASVSRQGFDSASEPLGEEKTKAIKLAASAGAQKTFFVTVKDDSGNAKAGALVAMNSFSGSLQSTTDSSGQASFTVQEIPSQATFTAALEGFRQDNPVAGSSQRIESNLVEIVLKPSSSIQPRQGTLRVTVVDESGEEVSSAKVTLINAVTQGERAKSSGSDGRADFEGIDFGFRYYVKAEATGFTNFVYIGSRVFSEEGTLVRV